MLCYRLLLSRIHLVDTTNVWWPVWPVVELHHLDVSNADSARLSGFRVSLIQNDVSSVITYKAVSELVSGCSAASLTG
jgi:hypothetical protein